MSTPVPRLLPAADDGGVASTELVILFPLIIMLTLFPFQVAIHWHAKQTADLAAETAVDVGQVEGATPAAASAAAGSVLAATGQVTDAAVEVNRGGDVITVRVRGRSRFRVLPGNWRVEAVAQGRIERFVGEDER